MKCQILFSRKNKKHITDLSSAESAHSAVNVNTFLFIISRRLKDGYKKTACNEARYII